MSFARASAVSGGPGRWSGEVPDGWDIFGVPNGGLLMGTATRAMGEEVDGRQLISATGTFLNRSTPGRIDIDVEVLKAGRNLSMLRATLSQGGNLVSVTGVYAEPDRPKPEQNLVIGKPPDLPPPEECLPVIPSGEAPLPPPFTGNIDLRVHPEDGGFVSGTPGDTPLIRTWFRLRDGEPLDAHGLVLATDASAPAIFNSPYPAGWTPTVELTVQIRNPEPSGWLACRFTTSFVTDGMLEEDGEIWTEDGTLVALSRQLALVPR